MRTIKRNIITNVMVNSFLMSGIIAIIHFTHETTTYVTYS
jgi:hypothetical protein